MALPSTVDFEPGDTNYVTQLDQLVTDINALYAFVVANVSGGLFSGTDAGSWTMATGASQTFSIDETDQRAFAVGMGIHIARTSDPTNYFADGTITAYTHPNITINVASKTGTGSYSGWTLSFAPAASSVTSLGVGTATANQFITVNSTASAIIGQTLPLDGYGDIAFWMGTT